MFYQLVNSKGIHISGFFVRKKQITCKFNYGSFKLRHRDMIDWILLTTSDTVRTNWRNGENDQHMQPAYLIDGY